MVRRRRCSPSLPRARSSRRGRSRFGRSSTEPPGTEPRAGSEPQAIDLTQFEGETLTYVYFSDGAPDEEATRGGDRQVRGGIGRRRSSCRSCRSPISRRRCRRSSAAATCRTSPASPTGARSTGDARRHERGLRRRLQLAVPARPGRHGSERQRRVPRRSQRHHDERPVHQRRRVQRGRGRDPDRVDVGRDGRRRQGGPGGERHGVRRSRSTSPATASARCSASSARRCSDPTASTLDAAKAEAAITMLTDLMAEDAMNPDFWLESGSRYADAPRALPRRRRTGVDLRQLAGRRAGHRGHASSGPPYPTRAPSAAAASPAASTWSPSPAATIPSSAPASSSS